MFQRWVCPNTEPTSSQQLETSTSGSTTIRIFCTKLYGTLMGKIAADERIEPFGIFIGGSIKNFEEVQSELTIRFYVSTFLI